MIGRAFSPDATGPTGLAVAEAELQRHLYALAHPRDPHRSPEALEAAADYIAAALNRAGLLVTEDPFRFEGRTFRNIVGTLPGYQRPREWVLVVAHYDTVAGSPGADDNASGVAALLEIARVLAPYGYDRSLQLIGTSLEESDYAGSRHLARRARRGRLDIRGVLDLEMVGYTADHQGSPGPGIRVPDRGDFIGVVGNLRSGGLVAAFEKAARRAVPDLPVQTLVLPENGESLPAARMSDHAPFWDAGYAALLITDTSFLRNPHYHLPSDTVETLDLPFLRRVAAATAATAARLAR